MTSFSRGVLVTSMVTLVACFGSSSPEESEVLQPGSRTPASTSNARASEVASEQLSENIGISQSQAWMHWIENFGSTSPLLSLRKNRPPEYQVSDEQIERVLQGNQRISFSPPLASPKGSVSTLDLLNLNSFRSFELDLHGRRENQVGQALTRQEQEKISRRFRVIRENLQTRVAEREPTELQIFFVGETHALDLYFSQFLTPHLSSDDPLYRVRNEVVYFSMPVKAETKFMSDDYYEFITLFRGTPIQPDTFEQNSKTYVGNFLARLGFNHRLKSGLVTLEDLLTEDLSQVGNLVFMDWHQIRAAEVFESMPIAQSLSAAKVEKVSVYVESLRSDQKYSLNDFKRSYYFGLDSFLGEEDQSYYRQFRPEVYRALERGFVMNETLEALHRKLREYEQAGLEVEIRGLEEVQLF